MSIFTPMTPQIPINPASTVNPVLAQQQAQQQAILQQQQQAALLAAQQQAQQQAQRQQTLNSPAMPWSGASQTSMTPPPVSPATTNLAINQANQVMGGASPSQAPTSAPPQAPTSNPLATAQALAATQAASQSSQNTPLQTQAQAANGQPTAPPANQAPTITIGGQTYTVPGGDQAQYLRNVFNFESGGFNPNAVSSAGAFGISQLMPGTAQDWLKKNPSFTMDQLKQSPALQMQAGADYWNQQTGQLQKLNVSDRGASYLAYLTGSPAFAANVYNAAQAGNGQTVSDANAGALSNNQLSEFSKYNSGLLSPDMPAAQLLANARAIASGSRDNIVPPSATADASSNSSQSDSSSQSSQATPPPFNINSLIPQTTPVPIDKNAEFRNKLLAFAGAQLSGAGFWNGLGNGLTAASKVGQDNLQNNANIQAVNNQNAVNIADAKSRLAELAQYKPAGITFNPATGQATQNFYNPMNPSQMYSTPLSGGTPIPIATAQARANASGQNKANDLVYNSNFKTADTINTQAQLAQTNIDQTNNLINSIAANPASVGSTFQAKLAQALAKNFGISSDNLTPDGLYLNQQGLSALQTGQLGNLKTQAGFYRLAGPELPVIMKNLLTPGMSPGAITSGLQALNTINARTLRLQQELDPNSQYANPQMIAAMKYGTQTDLNSLIANQITQWQNSNDPSVQQFKMPNVYSNTAPANGNTPSPVQQAQTQSALNGASNPSLSNSSNNVDWSKYYH